jgi:oligopeptide transport system permease protein
MTTQAQRGAFGEKATAKPLVLENPKSRGLWADAFTRLLRNRMAVLGLIIIAVLVLCAFLASTIAPKDYAEQVLSENNAVPSWIPAIFPTIKVKGTPNGFATIIESYPFGADSLGRDILSRLLYGTRISLSVALIGPLMALTIGMTLGSIAGFYGGWVDNLIMRLVDLMYAFPTLLFIILLMAVFRSGISSTLPGSFTSTIYKLDAAFGGLLFIFIGIGITSWQNMARLTRGQVLSVRQREYVQAAESIGMSRTNILVRHILPNILGPLIVAETLAIPNYIATEAFLSFIGLGVNRPTPSWGSMIAEGAGAMRSFPNQIVFPALALALAMFAFNFLGDGLRDALDPRMRGVS